MLSVKMFVKTAKSNTTVFVIISLLLFNSCEDEYGIFNRDYKEYRSKNSIETDIEFYPFEIFENYSEADTAVLKLSFQSEVMFPCCNFPLLTTIFFEEEDLIIRFDDIPENGTCLTSPGPATTSIDLPENIEKLVLLNGRSMDVYQIENSREFVEISPIKQDYTSLRYGKIYKYPENTFMYQFKGKSSKINIFNDFLQVLTDSLLITEFHFNGEGVIPYTENSSYQDRVIKARYFQYENEIEFDKAGKLLEDFVFGHIEPNTGTLIRLKSWNNKQHLSWRY